jgi:hypothetical protein
VNKSDKTGTNEYKQVQSGQKLTNRTKRTFDFLRLYLFGSIVLQLQIIIKVLVNQNEDVCTQQGEAGPADIGPVRIETIFLLLPCYKQVITTI